MSRQKKFRLGLCLACEHIVQGIGNKPTFVGTYTGDILVAQVPADFWVAFYIEILDIAEIPEKVRVELALDGKIFAGADAVKGAADPSQPINMILPSGVLHIDGPARMTATLKGDGYANTIAIDKRILLQTA